MEFDVLTMAVLVGAIYGPIGAWNAAKHPAPPWSETGTGVRAVVIVGLVGTVAAVVALAVLDRPLLAALLAGSALASYLLARHRRSRP